MKIADIKEMIFLLEKLFFISDIFSLLTDILHQNLFNYSAMPLDFLNVEL